MATVGYIHICDYAFAGEGGKPCIIGVFDFLRGAGFPLQHTLMYVAVSMKGAPHESVAFTIDIAAPDGTPFARIDATAQLGDGGMTFMPIQLPNVVFPQPGVYVFTVRAAGQELARTSLHAQLHTEPSAGRPS